MTKIKATIIDHMGSDLTVVNAARVSFGKYKEELDEDKDVRLINYLGRNKHISPFGHCFASFHVKAPLFVARQLVKHKFLRWNEISRRYVDEAPEFYFPENWRARAKDKKQGSAGVHPQTRQMGANAKYVTLEALKEYNLLLMGGAAPEQARMILPQNMMTEWYWSGSLDAFADMCNLRCYPDAQEETRIVAEQIDKHMSFLYPHSWKALRK